MKTKKKEQSKSFSFNKDNTKYIKKIIKNAMSGPNVDAELFFKRHNSLIKKWKVEFLKIGLIYNLF